MCKFSIKAPTLESNHLIKSTLYKPCLKWLWKMCIKTFVSWDLFQGGIAKLWLNHWFCICHGDRMEISLMPPCTHRTLSPYRKLWLELNHIYIWFHPFHTHLFAYRKHFMIYLWRIQIASIITIYSFGTISKREVIWTYAWVLWQLIQ